MPSPFPPPPEFVPDPDPSEPFTCPICYKDVSVDRPPNLNLDNCSCGEVRGGTSDNDCKTTLIDTPGDNEREARILEALNAPIDNDAIEDDQSEEAMYQTQTPNQAVQKEAAHEENENPSSPTKPSPPSLSFAMSAYLAATTPDSRSPHASLNLDEILNTNLLKRTHSYLNEPSNPSNPTKIIKKDIHHSDLLFSQSSQCATMATNSLRSSLSVASWGSQSRSFGSDVLGWMGGWQDEGDMSLEMSWSQVVVGNEG